MTSQTAWRDPDWYETDGMAIVYAETNCEAISALDMTRDWYQGEPEPQAERVEWADRLNVDDDGRETLALQFLVGCFSWIECVCGRHIDRLEVSSDDPCGFGGYQPASTEPVHVEGEGMFCSRACWEQFKARWRRGA